MSGIILDTERELLREVDISLKEWGRWSSDNIGGALGYPKQVPFTRIRGRVVEDVDMQRVEDVEDGYTVWKMVTLNSTSGTTRRRNLLLLFILKIHYAETTGVMDKVHHAGKKFHQALSRSQYYVLLREARLKLATLIY